MSTTLPPIGILGSGNVGRALGIRQARLSYPVFFGARRAAQSSAAASAAGSTAQHGTIADAASFGAVLAHIIRELFSLSDKIKHPSDCGLAQGIQDDSYNEISPKDWLCTKCLRELLRRRLFVWWAVQRRTGKVANTPALPTKNCRCISSFVVV